MWSKAEVSALSQGIFQWLLLISSDALSSMFSYMPRKLFSIAKVQSICKEQCKKCELFFRYILSSQGVIHCNFVDREFLTKTQKALTCSRLTVEIIAQDMKYLQSSQQRHQNDAVSWESSSNTNEVNRAVLNSLIFFTKRFCTYQKHKKHKKAQRKKTQVSK